MFLSVGELNKNKNHIVVVRALADLKKKGLHTKYVICGVGSMKEELMKTAKQLGYGDDLKLVGYQLNTEQYYHAADFFIFPSLREGLGMALLEAMACGCCCLGNDTRGIEDLIVENKEDLLFKANSVQDTESKISRIVNNPNVWKYRIMQMDKVISFSSIRSQQKMLDIYNELK